MSMAYVTDRERLEASLLPKSLLLADAFAAELTRLGHHDFAHRRALLLALAAIVDGSPKGRDGEARLDAKHDSGGAGTAIAKPLISKDIP